MPHAPVGAQNGINNNNNNAFFGRAIAQAVMRWFLIVETGFNSMSPDLQWTK
jgi:hypothetical protein